MRCLASVYLASAAAVGKRFFTAKSASLRKSEIVV